MKNLLIYINSQGFAGKYSEYEKLLKIQIDNSLDLGWRNEDMLLVTNFPYEYNGVRALEVPFDMVYSEIFCGSKILSIVYLISEGFIKENELYWYHDLDAYQLLPVTEDELELKNVDAGFCDYGRIQKWQLGSFFFKRNAKEIFSMIAEKMGPLGDEDTLVYLTNNNINDINSKIKRLNGRYDFGMRKIELCFEKAIKPLKVLHFHPNNPLLNTLAIAMYGKNRIKIPLMNNRLIEIFHKYNYK